MTTLAQQEVPVTTHAAIVRHEKLTGKALQAYFEAIWDEVLVPICGANTEPYQRFSFVFNHTDARYPANQYRFCGLFGMGGKLITASSLACSVSYYPEDKTAKRDAAQDKANEALRQLYDKHVGTV